MAKNKIDPVVKAQAALDVQDRKIEALKKRRSDLMAQTRQINAELTPLERQREYLASNPLLAQPTQATPEIPGQTSVEDAANADE